MSIAHSFMSILIHRAGFMSIARYEFYDNIGSMYELCSYYDSGFIMNELCSYISYMTFIMIPTVLGRVADDPVPREEAEDEVKKGDDKDEGTKKPDEAKSSKDAERSARKVKVVLTTADL